ncbi:MAG: 6,7-dimethyl-8-ribityllumazine synthase [Phycisphaerales bacterium]|nr:6,7-dimethyl-8-ribityllumazine synthase [Phycisphaerales bacterium]
MVSRYHPDITGSMRDAAVKAFGEAGGVPEHMMVVDAAGAWELTPICRALAMKETRAGRPEFDAVVAIGCLIAGETAHDQHIARSVTQGLTDIMVETGTPIAFGVLTCQTIEQAKARSIKAGAKGGMNKGAEAMLAAIHACNSIKAIEASPGRPR